MRRVRSGSASLGGTDVRADRPGNVVTISIGNLCDRCADKPGSVAALAARTGTYYEMAMRAGQV